MTRNKKHWINGYRRKDAQSTSNAMEKVWEVSGQYKDSYKPDVEAGLARFKQRIAQEQTTKYQDEGQVVKMPRRRFPLAWAAAIAGLVLALGWFVLKPGATGPMVASTFEEEQKTVELPDGSVVLLNENSELDYVTFGKDDVRLVRFSGEALF